MNFRLSKTDPGVTVAVHQPECFPWLGFIDKALRCDVFVLLDDVQYAKNGFQNRNRIRTADGWQWLTVPVSSKGRFGQRIIETRVAPAGRPRWRGQHLASWTQNYASAPYSRRYFPFLRSLYAREWECIVDFNLAVIAELLPAFGVKARVVRSSELAVEGSSSRRLVSICRTVGGGVYLSGVGGMAYLDEKIFDKAGIKVRYQDFKHPLYPQAHMPFIPCMSAFDMLMNLGPRAAKVLMDASAPRPAFNGL